MTNGHIITSRSAVAAWQECPRRRFYGFEALNAAGSHGWERSKLALPLVTGIHAHVGIVGDGTPSTGMLAGEAPELAISRAVDGYRADVQARGLEVEVDGAENHVVEEQCALIEALLWGWQRTRLKKWLDEFEVLSLEQERVATLSDDVILATRDDALVRRRVDGKVFLVNFKTVGDAADWWYQQWELDMQLMTETLAVEQAFGERVAGVIIEGLIKGKRYKDKDEDGHVISVRQTSPLIYGYKFDGNPPLEPPGYDWNYTRKKGWHRFAVWEEQFNVEAKSAADWGIRSSVEHWVNWLPEEIVEKQYAIVPPIYRNQQALEAKVRQIVGMEHLIRAGVVQVEADGPDALDHHFPQNESSCQRYGRDHRCAFYDLCHSPGVGDDPAGSGLYVARVPNHPIEVEAL